MLRGFDSRTLEVKFGSLEVELGSKSVVRTHFSRFLASGSKFCTLRFGFGLPRVKSKDRGSQFFDLYLGVNLEPLRVTREILDIDFWSVKFDFRLW